MEDDIVNVEFQGKKFFFKKSEWDNWSRWEGKQRLMVENGAASPSHKRTNTRIIECNRYFIRAKIQRWKMIKNITSLQ